MSQLLADSKKNFCVLLMFLKITGTSQNQNKNTYLEQCICEKMENLRMLVIAITILWRTTWSWSHQSTCLQDVCRLSRPWSSQLWTCRGVPISRAGLNIVTIRIRKNSTRTDIRFTSPQHRHHHHQPELHLSFVFGLPLESFRLDQLLPSYLLKPDSPLILII